MELELRIQGYEESHALPRGPGIHPSRVSFNSLLIPEITRKKLVPLNGEQERFFFFGR